MKKPDEVKKGLECCSGRDNVCDGCPYANGECSLFSKLAADALAYIQQLERGIKIIAESNASAYKKRDSLEQRIIQLQEKCLQLERERDAAVADIPRACGYCKWFEVNLGGNMTECHNPNGCRNISGINTGFEWRGVKEE